MKRFIFVVCIIVLGLATSGLHAEDCISFNPDKIQVKRISGSWKIVEGSHWMFDFGNKRQEAVKAYKIIKHYGMNQSCFVGRPDPSFQYMLVSGNAPAGSFPGEDCVSFNPDTIAVKFLGGRWKIVDGSHWMFDFGNKKGEAYEAYKIIKKYGFNRSCFVGRPDPSFKYLKKVEKVVIKPGLVKPGLLKPVLPLKEDCISFNPMKIQIKQINGRWKIVEGSHWIFDFNGNRQEAIQAFRVIKHYGMDQSCYVGRPDPSFQYMLVSGNAPTGGSFPREDCVSFNPDTIEVKEIDGRWKIVDGNHWVFDFGNKRGEAYTAFRIIKKYGFHYSCYVGRPDPSFMYLKK